MEHHSREPIFLFSYLTPFGGAFRVALVVKNLTANAGDIREVDSIPGLGRSTGGGHWQPTPVFLPGESHGQRSLVGSILYTMAIKQTYTHLNSNVSFKFSLKSSWAGSSPTLGGWTSKKSERPSMVLTSQHPCQGLIWTYPQLICHSNLLLSVNK